MLRHLGGGNRTGLAADRGRGNEGDYVISLATLTCLGELASATAAEASTITPRAPGKWCRLPPDLASPPLGDTMIPPDPAPKPASALLDPLRGAVLQTPPTLS